VALPPRLTDASVLVAIGAALLTGLASLVATPQEWLVFVAHGAVGLTLVVLLAWKLRRVAPRIRAGARARSPTVAVSVLLTVLAVAALVTGIAWTTGLATGIDLAGWTVLNLHIGIALVLVVVLAAHLRRRFRTPSRADWAGRRTSLQYVGLAVGGALAWKLTEAVGSLTGARRFTGSRATDGSGNDFPVTSWMLDDPDPVAVEDWQLHVVGRVDRRLALGYDALPSTPSEGSDRGTPAVSGATERAILDCTSGWYADRDWAGVRIGDLLEVAGAHDDAARVVVHSVTGYRFDFPIEAADGLLLATRVDGERLRHGHGFPLRLVAPGRRGFQWVKWVTAVEVRRTRDPGSWVAVFASGLS